MDDDVPAYTFSVDQTLNKINLVDRGAIEFNMAHELARLRAALAEAERERDEARGELAVQDAISAMGAEWLVDLTSIRIKYDRQRRTIRALVVAARALRQAGWNWRGGRVTTDFMVLDVRARVAQIRLQEKLNSEQAGKE